MKKYRVTRILLILGVVFSGSFLLINQAAVARAAIVGTGVDSVSTSPVVTASTTYTVTTYNGVASATGKPPYDGVGDYVVNFNGNSISLDDFTIGGTTYEPADFANKIEFQRSGSANASDLFWAEKISFTADGSGGGDLVVAASLPTNSEQVINDDILNRGMDNLFANVGSNNNNDIERADFVFSGGLTPIAENLGTHGFLILDRGGNDSFRIAAITALDVNDDPSDYQALHSVDHTAAFGNTLLTIPSTVFRNDGFTVEFTPMEDVPAQNIQGVFVTFGDLGLSAGQTFYGFSLFPNDIPEATPIADLVSLATAPGTTDNTTGGLDLVGGTASVYSPGGTPTAVTMNQFAVSGEPLLSTQALLTAVFLLCLSSLYVLQKYADVEVVKKQG